MARALSARTRRYAVLSAALAAGSAVLLITELIVGMGLVLAPLTMLICAMVVGVKVVVGMRGEWQGPQP